MYAMMEKYAKLYVSYLYDALFSLVSVRLFYIFWLRKSSYGIVILTFEFYSFLMVELTEELPYE